MKDTIYAYYLLTKPGIIRGNAVHVIAGSLLASTLGFVWQPMIAVLVGTSLVIASACVANNYMDRGIDAKMKRTRRRPSVTGKIPLSHAMTFAVVLLIVGFAVLLRYTNPLVAVIGVIAYLTYVFAYGWAKRHTIHSTLIGAIPGALPAVAGYVAITGEMSIGAMLTGLLVFVWQMPHFYAISLFRKKEYAEAELPVLGVVRPFSTVRNHILGWILLYLVVVILMISADILGPPSGLLLLAGAAYWLVTFARVSTRDESKWARAVFGSSLVLTLALLAAGLLNVFVPPFE